MFRGSYDRWNVGQFHQKCDGMANTITLILTAYGKIIGGFTSLPWDSSNTVKV